MHTKFQGPLTSPSHFLQFSQPFHEQTLAPQYFCIFLLFIIFDFLKIPLLTHSALISALIHVVVHCCIKSLDHFDGFNKNATLPTNFCDFYVLDIDNLPIIFFDNIAHPYGNTEFYCPDLIGHGLVHNVRIVPPNPRRDENT